MKKQIIYGSIAFVSAFIILFLLFLPYDNLAAMGIAAIQKETKTNIRYSSISSGIFSTKLEDLEINEIPVGKVRIGYSPLSILTKSISLESTGAVNANIDFSPSDYEFDLNINSAIVNLLSDKAEFGGKITAVGTGSADDQTASGAVHLDKATIETPIGKLDFEKIDAEIDVKGNTVTIKKLTSKDVMALNLSGTINVNKKNFNLSLVNINGTVNVIGSEKKLTLKGRLNNLKPSIE